MPALVESFGFASARAPGYEADDFLAAAAKAEEKRGGTALVVTSDRDAFQLATAKTSIVRPVRGVSVLERIGPAEVRAIYGVEPEQVPDFIALRGDPSDKIPGAKGVGAKTAALVLAEHGTLEAALAAGRFESAGGGLEALPSNSDTRRLRPPPLPERPDTNLGGGVGSLTRARHERSREPARSGGRRDLAMEIVSHSELASLHPTGHHPETPARLKVLSGGVSRVA